MNTDLDEFLAHLDEITTDSSSVDHYQLQKQKGENKNLKSLLLSMRDSSRDILNLYKNERQTSNKLQTKLDSSVHELNELQKLYDKLERDHVNDRYLQNQLICQLQEKQAQEHADYVEISRDYFDLLSEATCFLNYQIKQSQNKIVSKTELFLRNALGEQFQKLPRILRSKRARTDDDKSTVSRSSSRCSKRIAKQSETVKRQKTNDIWDMKSISQASSPAATIAFLDEDTSNLSSDICEAGSSFSFNTFSIGNETSYSFLHNQPASTPAPKCKCHLMEENDAILVSVGTNTDPPFEEPLSVPKLLDDDFDPTPCDEFGEIAFDAKRLHNSSMKIFLPVPDTKAEKPDVEVISITSQTKDGEIQGEIDEPRKLRFFSDISNILGDTDSDDDFYFPSFATIGTNTEKETIEQSTSTDTVITSNKSTATVHSTTTRGTSTVSVATKSCGVQFPEVTVERIFTETIFELPDCIDPIEEVLPTETSSMETMTELSNVNREIGYTQEPSRKLKTERLVSEDLSSFEDEERSFIILGQTLFNLFLKRIQQYNDSLNDDEITRQKIWQHLKRQLLDRFSELTFDESLGMSDSELLERISDDKELKEASEASKTVHVNVIESETSCDDESMDYAFVAPEELTTCTTVHTMPSDEPIINYEEFEEILSMMKTYCESPPNVIEPLEELPDVIWDSLFPPSDDVESDDSPMTSAEVLDGFDVEHDPIEIPTENEEVAQILRVKIPVYKEFETPRSPPPFAMCQESYDEPAEIPIDCVAKPFIATVDSIIDFCPKMRLDLVQWQARRIIKSKSADKRLCKVRKSIATYLESEWTDENLELCLDAIDPMNEKIICEAIFETIEDNKWQTDVNTEFTPPAPPLPRYQQKLILLIKTLSEDNSKLPHRLIDDLEEKLFRLENSAMALDDLRNISYYYSSLVDLFFEGDTSMVFYFVVKSIYFFGYKSIPMVFVLIKAFPTTLPKKSQLLRKYSQGIDWENMSGLQLSKVHLDLDVMDSLDLTVMYVLTCIQQYRTRKHESNSIKDHELFNYLPKFYGFQLSFLAAPKLLDILIKRLEDGKLENLSLSLILLGKRTNPDFTLRTILKAKLMPLLSKFVAAMASKSNEEITQICVDQICMLVETISVILKPLHDEKEKSFKEVFPMIIGILGRTTHKAIQESCIKAILRLQRFIDNHKELFTIIQHHHEAHGSKMTDGLRYAIQTIIHRKNENFFKNSTAS